MKNLIQNATMQQVVKASSTTNSKQGFYQKFNSNLLNGKGLTSFAKHIFTLFCIMFIMQVASAQTVLKGGTQKVPATATGGANNEVSVTLVNGTGHDIWDLRITTKTGKLKSYDVQGKNGKLAGDKVTPNAASVHVKFSKPVKTTPPNNVMVVKVTTTAPNDTIIVTPTDSLGADLMIDKNSNTTTTGSNKQVAPKPVKLSGGVAAVTIDPSNFPSVDFANATGQDICDLKIFEAKDATGKAAKIDSVYVNDSKVYGAPPSASSVHVYFPCVANGGTIKVSVKFHGTIQVVTYKVIPTNKDSANIVCSTQTLEPLKQLPNSGVPGNGKTVVSGAGSASNKVSFACVSELEQNIHDFIVQAYDNGVKVKIKMVKIDGNVWPIGSATSSDSTVVHVDKGSNPSLPKGSKFPVTVEAASATATIDSVKIQPTDSLGHLALVMAYNGGMNAFLMPNENAPFGANGRSGGMVAINEGCDPISQLIFSSPDPGVKVDGVTSSSPYTFNDSTQTLLFDPPIPAGTNFGFNYTLNTLLPYSPTDSFPYTTIQFFAPGSLPFLGYSLVTPSSCSSSTNGSIDFTMVNGLPPFSFLWSTGSTDEDLTNVSVGTYTLTVTSPSGCMQKVFTVPPIEELAFNAPPMIIPINVWCTGANNGKAIAVTDGIEPIAYLWSNGATTGIIDNLPPATYTLTVITTGLCNWTGTVTITEPTPVAVSGTITKPNCNGEYTGAINITATGGNNYYIYKWNGGSTLEDKSAIKAATYTVTVKDGLGCSTTTSFKVKQPAVLNLTTTGTNVQCGGGNNGSAIATSTGGTMPYNFQWSNGMTGSSVTGLTAGTYNVMLNDAHGCNTGSTVNISQPPPMMINIFPIGTGGQAMAQVNGGFPPYQYQWNTIPVQTTQIANGLLPNHAYTVMVIDAHGCMQAATVFMPPMRIGGDADGLNITALPNPTTGLVTVEFANTGLENYLLQLSDVAGRIVYEATESQQSVQLDLSKFDNGIYSLKVSSNNKVEVTRLVLQKN
ncbi:MAG: T9SS type A sorting domain-containing protein [Bacteroidia bacterium]